MEMQEPVRNSASSGPNTLTGFRRELNDTNRPLNRVKNELLAMAAEFVGTTMFLLFAFIATHVVSTPATPTATGDNPPDHVQALLYISLAFGFSLAVNVWVFFRVSGGLFNPVISMAYCLVGSITPLRAVLLTLSQLLGGMSAAAIASALVPGQILTETQLNSASGISISQGLFMEMFMACQVVITVLLLAAEKSKTTILAPLAIGFAQFVVMLAGTNYTGASANPARSFGPCVADRHFDGYHWIYWVGPYLGGLVAVGFYWFLKVFDYEQVNPNKIADLSVAEKSRDDAGESTRDNSERV